MGHLNILRSPSEISHFTQFTVTGIRVYYNRTFVDIQATGHLKLTDNA
jgi:hypothetical protein